MPPEQIRQLSVQFCRPGRELPGRADVPLKAAPHIDPNLAQRVGSAPRSGRRSTRGVTLPQSRVFWRQGPPVVRRHGKVHSWWENTSIRASKNDE